MANHRSRIAGTLLAVITLAASLAAPPAQAADFDLHARMHATSAYPYAHGGASYDGHRGWRAFGIQVGGIQKLAGKTVTVTVHGALVGRMRVSQYGTAHLYRRADTQMQRRRRPPSAPGPARSSLTGPCGTGTTA